MIVNSKFVSLSYFCTDILVDRTDRTYVKAAEKTPEIRLFNSMPATKYMDGKVGYDNLKDFVRKVQRYQISNQLIFSFPLLEIEIY